MHAAPVQKKRHPKSRPSQANKGWKWKLFIFVSDWDLTSKRSRMKSLRLHAVVLARAENNEWKIIFCSCRYAC